MCLSGPCNAYRSSLRDQMGAEGQSSFSTSLTINHLRFPTHPSEFHLPHRREVKGDLIEVTTVKTADSLCIELNDVSNATLEK